MNKSTYTILIKKMSTRSRTYLELKIKYAFALILFISILWIIGCTKPAESKHSTGIAGIWRVVEFADFDSTTNVWVDRYGKNPKGYFIYTPGGVLSINVSHEHPLKISEEEGEKYSVNVNDFFTNNSFGYFGTYTYTPDKGQVIHHVQGGTIPGYIDTDQPRQIEVKGDTAIIGDNINTRRVLLRVE